MRPQNSKSFFSYRCLTFLILSAMTVKFSLGKYIIASCQIKTKFNILSRKFKSTLTLKNAIKNTFTAKGLKLSSCHDKPSSDKALQYLTIKTLRTGRKSENEDSNNLIFKFVTSLLYKNILYKNIEAENGSKIKNILRMPWHSFLF